ncbi:MAG TPA: RNA polymerase sigma factor [Acidimicrobiales bacterium]
MSPDTPSDGPMPTIISTFREEWGRIVATLVRRTGDWDLAEECTQDAFERALARWPHDGVPERPGAWLMTVARNRAVDRLRRDTLRATKLQQVAMLGAPDASRDSNDEDGRDGDSIDERLRLIFTCCHPALALEARVALTLRTLTGLSTSEIARASLVPEATMAKRLVRAKHKIANAGIPYRVPSHDSLGPRTTGVLAVIYLLFNEGYSASAGSELVRTNLCEYALELARLVAHLLPEEPEAKGLVALTLFQHSRHDARVDARGNLVTLEDQDRSRWNRDDIDEAQRWLNDARMQEPFGPYQLQAAIAAHHARADSTSGTDWRAIARLYGQLVDATGSPVVELNRAVAVAMCDGPATALDLVDRIAASATLQGYYLLPATRADFLRRLGRRDDAARSYRQALDLVGTEPERRFLTMRLAEVTD